MRFRLKLSWRAGVRVYILYDTFIGCWKHDIYVIYTFTLCMSLAQMIPFSKLYYTVFELPCKFRRHAWYGQNIVVQSRTGRRTFPNLIYKGRRPLATDSEKWRDTVQTFWRCCMLIDTYWYIYIYTHTHSISLKIFCSWCKGGLFGDEACQASRHHGIAGQACSCFPPPRRLCAMLGWGRWWDARRNS